MTLTTWNTLAIGTNAQFQAWALQVHTAILATGLVQTADTGQIVFSTVSVPVATNTKAGYAMYAFNDSNQGSYPCYIRVDFGTASSLGYPSMWIQIGTSTNGAGVIGTIQSPTIQTQEIGVSYISGISGTSLPRPALNPRYALDNEARLAHCPLVELQCKHRKQVRLARRQTKTGRVFSMECEAL